METLAWVGAGLFIFGLLIVLSAQITHPPTAYDELSGEMQQSSTKAQMGCGGFFLLVSVVILLYVYIVIK